MYDNWQTIGFAANLLTQLQNPMLAFLNLNNRDSVGDVRTPQPGTNVQTLYYMSPTNSAGRVAVIEMTGETGSQVYVSPDGTSIAYLRIDAQTPGANGLYIVDLEVGISGRVLPITSLVQRGIFTAPSWTSDGDRLAIALATGYDIDIYSVGRDGSNPTNLTNSGAYDFWPVWSPDGRYIAFVSDRAICPSWIPDQPGTCAGSDAPPPNGGHVYVLDVTSGDVSQLSDQWVFEPPRWVNARQVVFASGDPAFGDPERALWSIDVISGQSTKVTLSSGDDSIKLSEAWAPSGRELIYQAAGTTTEIVLTTINGQEIGRINDVTFARYGLSAAWSPDGTKIALGGINGQCPYGVLVYDNSLASIARGNPPPSMCEPTYSSDGRFLAFTGVNPQIDGRVDIYSANDNGFGAVNLTGTLRGSIDLLGWVGGQ
jgi:Tol biopolymer transport system component